MSRSRLLPRTLRMMLAACALVLIGAAQPARAAEPASEADLEAVAASSRSAIREGIEKLGALDDPAAIPVLRALRDGALRADGEGRLFIVNAEGKALSATRGTGTQAPESELRKPNLNAPVRSVLISVLSQLELRDPDAAVRAAAARELAERGRARPGLLESMERAYGEEKDEAIRAQLLSALVELRLGSEDPAVRIAAVRAIAESRDLRFLPRLQSMIEPREDGSSAEPDAAVRGEAAAVVTSLARSQYLNEAAQHLMYGISLGSVLLLASLGLAITFGLMGVINMAHGEMIMIGAYCTYSVQVLFEQYAPGAQDFYLLVALPVAFAVTTLLGMALERLLIRRLYGRPLETLLMTWGISLILIQAVRMIFGAQNVRVANPGWLSGYVEVLSGVALPYPRIATVLFSGAILAFVWLVLQRTRLGLELRAVTQNRKMAASMGIPTERIDQWTFGLGSGIAGLSGVALSQMFNVGPELGQDYIVDCFMVVVLGGVGKLAGAVAGALGLGVVNKVLEPISGAVLGKIAVLVLVILSIQWRPEGIFALRGRAAES